MNRILTPAQVEQYQEEGYLIVEGVVDDVTRQRMKHALAELVEKSRAVSQHDDIYDLEPSHTADDPRVRRIKKPHLVNPVFNEFLHSAKFKAITQDLLGESVRLHGSKLNLKAPHFGSPVEWHQDWAFYPYTNDDVTAAGVMLDDTTVENGAMYVIPRSHLGPTFDHHGPDGHFCGAMDPDSCGVDFSKAVACEGAAGSVSFHHARTVHGSAQNTSNRSRGLLLYEMTAADAYPILARDDWNAFTARLLYGQECIEPRVVSTPIRMPLPPAKNQGSIYENQTAGKRYFGFVEQGGRKSATT
jgi:ectoine hydroxylase-related dioxygenase (phytanoyl-CoA dioxygenase family)